MKCRIKCTNRHGSVSYIHTDDGKSWSCTLANGVSASFHYAGILDDEMACRFALQDATDVDAVLKIVKERGSRSYQYEVV